MSRDARIIPVVLFAYARPAHLAEVLRGLRANAVPKVIVFLDAPRDPGSAAAVACCRALLRAVTWCPVELIERPANLGLGRNILAGVDEVAARYDAFIVWEDDLVCVPGTYAWLAAALRHYADDARVGSVTAWTHPRVTPPALGDSPYVDVRAECWVWGAWSRSWRGVTAATAAERLAAIRAQGGRGDELGADIPVMAAREQVQNTWAVRWLLHHQQHQLVCVRPPWSMVEHIGFDATATNAAGAGAWANPPLRAAPPIPAAWPDAVAPAGRAATWRAAYPAPNPLRVLAGRAWRAARSVARRVRGLRPRHEWFRGNYPDWSAARAASAGYEAPDILARVLAATRRVQEGAARWERDGVAFDTREVNAPLLARLLELAATRGGRVDVIDFGGALGSTWWQHRTVLAEAATVSWTVVEQPAFVAAGRTLGSDAPRFAATLAEALAGLENPVVLFSSVLCYVEDPNALLHAVAAAGVADVLVDRTPFVAGAAGRLCVQHTPPGLGGGSYPCWLFAEDALLAPLRADYGVAASWRALDELDPAVEHRGYHLARKR